MITLQSKITIESKAVPGVSFTLRRLNLVQRAKRDLQVMEARQKLNALHLEYRSIEKVPASDRSAEQNARLAAVAVEFASLENTEIKPTVIAAGLISIANLEIDGEAVTVGSLLEAATSAEDALIDEIYEACVGASRLDATETKNSSSPGTSGDPETPAKTDSTVIPAAN